jgi:DNA repair exonuclease SbcCD ATPase subunit
VNIIEKEIARREALIEEKDAKEEKILELEEQLSELRQEVAVIDPEQLEREIEELRVYLPSPAVEPYT